jgi:anti-sigma regulatory factor (Ser/Thr protein kinase)
VLWQTGRTFENTSRAPAEARRFVDDCLHARGLSGLCDRTLLGVSELMTNAVTHGHGRIGLTLTRSEDRLHVAVEDEGHSTPAMRVPDPARQVAGGWGLHLVESLADSWGVDTQGHGTVVWFEQWLPRPGRSRRDAP